MRRPQAEAVLKSIRRGQCYCTHECNFITTILLNPSPYPALARVYWELARSRGAHARRAAAAAEQSATDPEPEQAFHATRGNTQVVQASQRAQTS